MTAEKRKMLAGELYDPADPALVAERRRAREVLARLNDPRATDPDARRALLAELVGAPTDATVETPFHCDYGTNLVLGRGVFMNFGCVVLDVARVSIGDRVLMGPNVQLYAATHPMDAALRRRGLESGAPIAIGEDAWLAGGVIVCPGVTIGARTVVGAGSVVTRDLPADVFAAGNPCRVVRGLAR